MALRSLLTNLKSDASYQALTRILEQQSRPITWLTGLHGSARAFFWAGLRERLRRPILLITGSQEDARKLYDQCRLFLQHPDPEREALFLFPSRELLPYEHALSDMELEGERLEVLLKLARHENIMVISAIDQVLEKLPSPERLQAGTFTLHLGQHLDLDNLSRHLVALGYSRESLIEGRGQFAIRGGIMDIFCPSDLSPWRIELEGSEVATIRRFALAGQKTLTPGSLPEAVITPAQLFAPSGEEIEQGLARLDRSMGVQRVAALKEKIRTQGFFPGMEYYAAHFMGLGTLMDYLAPETVVIMDGPGTVQKKSADALNRWTQLYREHKPKEPLLSSPEELLLPFNDLKEFLDRHACVFSGLLKQTVWPDPEPDGEWQVTVKSTTPLRGNLELLVREIKSLKEKGLTIHITAHNEAELGRLKQVLAESMMQLEAPDLLGQIVFHSGQLSEGFHYPACGVALFTDQEIFNRHLGRPKPRRQKGMAYPSQPIADILELKPGDLAVHRDHGIGRYLGVTKLSIDAPDQEFVQLAYAGEEKLYVPMDQLRLLEKYVGSDQAPRINKLGTAGWEKTKQRIKASVTELARQLLDIYAAREVHLGHGYQDDTPLQRAFEEAFPYEETPDQIRAIEETKKDMQSPKPMDRLICGDVGYGKTEVAMRAAFKAVQEGCQVAVLVPTTILADQHFATFKERMATFPVSLALVSRFKSTQETREILQDVAQGRINVIIGTHKLLGKDIKFARLGLIVLDEEHRFGVAQKEKLKKMRSTVDVLTLSATPIPRTLYLSLSGIRDISVIETPPLNRLPIKTQVMEFSESAVREAITRELARGGQVFFIHNRVQSIGSMAERIKRLVPEARLAIAHGQMKRDELEPVMERFLAKAEDVLVSTTIVESGLDMPNVNTIIINRADALGMAQLYQLRGRVGRADRQAYAYLFYPQGGAVTSDAEKRLNSLQEFTELGSGIKIAMRDMEIRGTGDMLGPDQSGHVTAVGFETYCSLLEEAVREIRGQKSQVPAEVKMNLPLEAFVPKDFIPDTMTRLNLYKRLSSMKHQEELDDLAQEVTGRFGRLPDPMVKLLDVTSLKLMAAQAGLKEVTVKPHTILMTWPAHFQPPQAVVDKLLSDYTKRIRFIPGDEISLEWSRPAGGVLEGLKNCLSELRVDDIKKSK